MKPKTLFITAFVLVALAQLFVPYQMISKQAGIASTGSEFKFKTAFTVDAENNHSGSSLRGKYIWLKFEEDHLKVTDHYDWEGNQSAYVLFTKDSEGFAKIKSVTKIKPANSNDWVRARVWINRKDSTSIQLSYPFNSYYIEDKNPKDVDSIIKKDLNDSLKINYLTIKIKDNQFLVGDLLINGASFKNIGAVSK